MATAFFIAAGGGGPPGPPGPPGAPGAPGTPGAPGPLPLDWIWGFTLSTPSDSPATRVVDITDGICRDSTNAVIMDSAGASFTLSFNNPNGALGLDVGAISASTFYFIYAIFGAVPGTSVIASLSPIAPALPAGFTHFRRTGFVRSNSGASGTRVIGSMQVGNERDRWTYVEDTLGAGQQFVTPLGIVPAVYTPYAVGSQVVQTARRARGNLTTQGGLTDYLIDLAPIAGSNINRVTVYAAPSGRTVSPLFYGSALFDFTMSGGFVHAQSNSGLPGNANGISWSAFNELV